MVVESGSSRIQMLPLCLLFVGLLFASGCCQQTTTERPVMNLCMISGDFVKHFTNSLMTFVQLHQKIMAENGTTPFNTGRSKFKFPFGTVYNGSLYNAENLYIGDGTNVTCDQKQMNVRLIFGVRDPILKARVKTTFGVEAEATVTMKHFEAAVTAVLPRKSQRISVEEVEIIAMDDLNLDVKTISNGKQQIDLSTVANAFLKTTPKGVLFPLLGAFMKEFAQQYLDENPLPL